MPLYEIIVMDTTSKRVMGHIEARITCLDTGDARIVNWDGLPEHQLTPSTSNPKKLKSFNIKLEKIKTESCMPHFIILYSHIENNLDEFSEAIKQYMNPNHCDKMHESQCSIVNNCSDAVNFTLNYFFPDNRCVEGAWQTFKCITFPVCIGTFGFFSCCFGAPPGINQPKDVMKKAWLLSFKYGKNPMETNIQEYKAPELQKMM